MQQSPSSRCSSERERGRDGACPSGGEEDQGGRAKGEGPGMGSWGLTLKMLRKGIVPWEKRCTKSVSNRRLM